MYNTKMRLPLQTPLLRSLVLLSIFALCYCAPQGYYNNGYNPYRTSGNSQSVASTNNRAYSTPINRNSYLSNNYNSNYNSYYKNNKNYNAYATAVPSALDAYSSKRYQRPAQPGQNRVSKADAENAKFAGVRNLEHDDESAKTAFHLKRKLLKKQKRKFSSRRCFPYGRDAATRQVTTTPPPREQGRFLWDLNIYNVYPSYGGPLSDCGGGGGLFDDYGSGFLGGGLGSGGFGGGLGGLLSDEPAYPTRSPLNNFLNLFAPGILQNALAATLPPPRPQYQSDPTGLADQELNDLQSDPTVDPGYRPQQDPLPEQQRPIRPQRRPQRRPNQVYYDTAGAPPLTPAQLVGGVSTTVNGFIQQLTGNVQPVYPSSYRRSARYG